MGCRPLPFFQRAKSVSPPSFCEVIITKRVTNDPLECQADVRFPDGPPSSVQHCPKYPLLSTFALHSTSQHPCRPLTPLSGCCLEPCLRSLTNIVLPTALGGLGVCLASLYAPAASSLGPIKASGLDAVPSRRAPRGHLVVHNLYV